MANTMKKENVVAIDAAAKAAEMERVEQENAAKKLATAEGRATFFRDMAELGLLDRSGKQSPFRSAMRFQQAIRDGFAFYSTEDARDAYKAYAGHDNGDVVGVDKVTATLATQTACLLTFGAPASVHAGEALYVQIDAVIHGYAAKDLTGSKIRCYEKANRELHKLFVEKFKLAGGNTAAALDATMKACDDAAIASWLIKEGASKIGEGEAEAEGAAKSDRSPLDKLNTVLTSAKSLIEKEFADNDTLKRALKILSGEYHDLAGAAAKRA